MSMKEADRLAVVTKLINKQLVAAEATLQLGLTVRQVKRIKKRVKNLGAAGLAHRGRGRTSNRSLKQVVVDKIVAHLKEAKEKGFEIQSVIEDLGNKFILEDILK